MRRFFVITTLAAMLASMHCCAQKSTIDPNMRRPDLPAPAAVTPAAPKPYDPAKDIDTRMAEKVSCEAIHQRLSTVAAYLSRTSGVPISCGKSKNDWQTRDIPVTLYAKDLPLGVLLRALARATHNVLRTEKLNDAISYRILQDPKLTRAFEDYEKARSAYRHTMAAWNWDYMLLLNDIPASELKTWDTDAVTGSVRVNAMKKMGALLSALGPENKQRVLAGEQIRLDPQEASDKLRPALMDALSAFDQLRLTYRSNSWRSNPNEDAPTTLTPDELAKSTLVLHLPDSDDSGMWTSAYITAGGSIGLGLPISAYGHFKPDKNGKQPGPTRPPPPSVKDENLHDIDCPGLDEKTREVLKVNVDMDDWADKKGLNSAAVMAELAKRAGFSIVMEDWDYHHRYPSSPQHWLKKGVSLEQLRFYRQLRLDAENKLIVALSGEWVDKHRSLAPASTIDLLTKKLESGLIELEDLLPVMLFTNGQWQEWIGNSARLDVIGRHISSMGDPLWQFFAMLTPQDRALAATEEGLSMARFDTSVVADLLARCTKAKDKHHFPSTSRPAQPKVADEDGYSRLVMRLKAMESNFYPTYGGAMPNIPKDKPRPRGLDRTYSYSLYISGAGEDSKTRYADSSGPWQLPFYSKEREDELLKALQEDTKTAPGAVPTTKK